MMGSLEMIEGEEDFTIVEVNPAMAFLFDKTCEEVRGRRLSQFFTEEGKFVLSSTVSYYATLLHVMPSVT